MRKHPAWMMWEAELTDEQCDYIIASGQTLEPQKARTFKDEDDPNRKTQVRWIHSDRFPDILELVDKYAREANKHFKLHITELPYLQYTEYKDIGHFYGDHHDVDWDRDDGLHRKISVVIQLSDPKDYEGGEFSFMTTQNPDSEAVKRRGTIIAFVSYYDHAVSPITEGNRNSLVGWYEGPRWC